MMYYRVVAAYISISAPVCTLLFSAGSVLLLTICAACVDISVISYYIFSYCWNLHGSMWWTHGWLWITVKSNLLWLRQDVVEVLGTSQTKVTLLSWDGCPDILDWFSPRLKMFNDDFQALCPETGLQLSISHWCDINSVNLPPPQKTMRSLVWKPPGSFQSASLLRLLNNGCF